MRVVFHDVTLSLDTLIYADKDVLADRQKIANAVHWNNGEGILHSLVLYDLDDQGQPLDLVFLSEDQSIGTENATVNISDANVLKVTAIVPIIAAEYVDFDSSQVVQKGPNDLGMAVQTALTDDGQRDVYLAAISRGTGTYTAAGIVLRIGFVIE